MATTTPNFGWAVPTSTDLVKDGAVAIETLGDSIDASLVDLKGGTTGQVLSKASNTDMDFTWVTDAAGDITGVTAGTGISGGGTSGTVTVTNSMATAIDAKGDLIVGTGADTFSRLAVGATAGHVLTVDSAEATGMKWAAAGGGSSGPAFKARKSSNQTITKNTATKVTFDTEDFDTASNFASSAFTPTTSGYYQFNVTLNLSGSGTCSTNFCQIYKNGAAAGQMFFLGAGGSTVVLSGSDLFYANGSTDYFEVYETLDMSGGGESISSGATASRFSGVWIRS
jgi:hypothetical protein